MDLTPETVGELTRKIEGLVELELGQRLPFVCLLLVPTKTGGGMAVFTNRRSDLEVELILEDALAAIKKPDAPWKRSGNAYENDSAS